MSNNHLHPIFQQLFAGFNGELGGKPVMQENSMVVGAATEYERQNPELTPQQEAALLESATDDVDLGDYWGDHLYKLEVSRQLRALCEAIRMEQDDATIARMARHLRTLAIDEVMSDD